MKLRIKQLSPFSLCQFWRVWKKNTAYYTSQLLPHGGSLCPPSPSLNWSLKVMKVSLSPPTSRWAHWEPQAFPQLSLNLGFCVFVCASTHGNQMKALGAIPQDATDLAWNSTGRLDWLVGKSQGSPISPSPLPRVSVPNAQHSTRHFLMGSGNQTQIFVLAKQMLCWLSHLSNPTV